MGTSERDRNGRRRWAERRARERAPARSLQYVVEALARAEGGRRPAVAEAWATPELAMRVSGHAHVVLAVKLDAAASAWMWAKSSLLAGGYTGTYAVGAETSVEDLVSSMAPPVDPPGGLRPVAVDEARELVWGAYAWSGARGWLEPGAEPALGALAPPAGDPERWAASFEGRFFGGQIDVADEQPGDWKGRGWTRADHPVDVRFSCATERPEALSTELDANRNEWSYDPASRSYAWHPPDRDGRPSPCAGALRIQGTAIDCLAFSAASAAAMATRLERLAPGGLELGHAHWLVRGTREHEQELVLAPARVRR